MRFLWLKVSWSRAPRKDRVCSPQLSSGRCNFSSKSMCNGRTAWRMKPGSATAVRNMAWRYGASGFQHRRVELRKQHRDQTG